MRIGMRMVSIAPCSSLQLHSTSECDSNWASQLMRLIVAVQCVLLAMTLLFIHPSSMVVTWRRS